MRAMMDNLKKELATPSPPPPVVGSALSSPPVKAPPTFASRQPHPPPPFPKVFNKAPPPALDPAAPPPVPPRPMRRDKVYKLVDGMLHLTDFPFPRILAPVPEHYYCAFEPGGRLFVTTSHAATIEKHYLPPPADNDQFNASDAAMGWKLQFDPHSKVFRYKHYPASTIDASLDPRIAAPSSSPTSFKRHRLRLMTTHGRSRLRRSRTSGSSRARTSGVEQLKKWSRGRSNRR